VNLRLGGGEVRVRLDRREAEALARGESLVDGVGLPGGGALRWVMDPGGRRPGLEWRDGELRIAVAGEALGALLELPPSKDLGIRAELPLEDGGTVALVVEVDLWTMKAGKRK
jgi:hypothetical protein